MKIKISILLLIGFVLVGCMPQSKYTPEEFDMPDNFRVSEVSSIDSEQDFTGDSLVYQMDSTKLAWNYYFHDNQLVELIKSGLEHNFDVRQALKTIEMHNLQFKQSKLELLPSVNATIGNPIYQYRSKDFHSPENGKWYDGKTAPENMFLYRAQNITGLNFNWEVDIWGKIRSQKEDVYHQYLATLEAKNAVQTQLITDIASGYYNLLSLYSQLDIAQSNYELAKSTLAVVELQFNAGNTTALAKQQTKTQMLVTKALIPRVKQQISQQENRLQFLTGKLPDKIVIDNLTFDEVFSVIEKNYELPLEVVKFRPDVKQAKERLWSANARVGVAQANQYPKLVIDLDFGVNSLLPTNWFNIPGALFGNLIGNLTQPIFNKKRLKTAFKQAELEREIAELEFQKTVYNAINEISNLLTWMNSLDIQIEIAEEQVFNSELSIFQSNLLFNSGYATYIEVIDAQRTALENDLHLNQLKEERLQLKVLIYKALGGGW